MLSRSWRYMTAVSRRITEPQRRQPARLLAALLVVLIPLGLLSATAQWLLIPGFAPTFAVIAGAMLGLAAAYGLTRSGRYTAGAVLTIAVTAIACFAAILANPREWFAYAYLVVSALLAGLLFAERGVLATAAANLLGLTPAPAGTSAWWRWRRSRS